MSRIDQDLRRGLRGLRESVDQEAAFRGVVSRKRRSRWLQPLQSTSLAALVLLGSAGGVYALWRVFDSSTPSSQAALSRLLLNSEEGMIAFSDHGQGGWDIFAMSPDGSQVIPVVEDSGDDVMPRLSRDGRTLAYVGLADSDALYVLDVEDGQARSVHSFGPDEQVSDMAWSPDGTEIALVIEEVIDSDSADPASPLSFIHVLEVATGNMQRITDTGREHSVDWSPDGSRILFGRSEPQPEGEKFRPNDLYLIEPDGTGEERLTNDGLSMQGTWSPDGNRIVFESYIPSEGAQTDIYVIDADGTGRTRLTENPGMDYYPVWSPDGSQILFVSRRADGAPTGPSSCHLIVIEIDGSDERSIISDRSFICSGDPSWT